MRDEEMKVIREGDFSDVGKHNWGVLSNQSWMFGILVEHQFFCSQCLRIVSWIEFKGAEE